MALFNIQIWGLALRWFFWFQKGGLYQKAGQVDIDDYLAMSRWLWSGNFGALGSYRPTQLIYPILLSPIHWFGISEQIYVLLLHSGLALLMVFFSYKIGKLLSGHRYGLLVAFLIASCQPTFTFFNWMFTDTLYYTAVMGFVLLTIDCWKRRRVWPLLIAGVFLFFIKPESVAPIGIAFAYRRSRRTLMAFGVIALLSITLVFSIRSSRMALLSHIHIANGLWLSTHTLINGDGEEQIFTNLRDEYKGYTGNLAMSYISLDIIKENPARYLLNIPIRWIAVWYPGLFRTRASTLWRIKDLMLCLFATIGSLSCLFFRREPQRGVAMIGMAMSLLVACYINDGNLRFRIPILLVFFTVSPLGWQLIFQQLQHLKSRYVIHSPQALASE